MTIERRIGIVGGNGWLGGAIARAALAAGAVDPGRLILSGRSERRSDLPVAFTRDNAELVAASDVVVLSVRPADFASVAIDARAKLVVSVMAGVPATVIAARTGADQVVRAMPNAAAAIGRSFTPWWATQAVAADDREIVQRLFNSCGEGAEVSSEAHVDYCVGLTGSGAAFPALLASAMIAHAVAQGLPAEFAARAARGVVAGASQLLGGAVGDAEAVVEDMMDYRGTTAAALQAMIEGGLFAAVAAGLDAAAAAGRSAAATLAPDKDATTDA